MTAPILKMAAFHKERACLFHGGCGQPVSRHIDQVVHSRHHIDASGIVAEPGISGAIITGVLCQIRILQSAPIIPNSAQSACPKGHGHILALKLTLKNATISQFSQKVDFREKPQSPPSFKIMARNHGTATKESKPGAIGSLSTNSETCPFSTSWSRDTTFDSAPSSSGSTHRSIMPGTG